MRYLDVSCVKIHKVGPHIDKMFLMTTSNIIIFWIYMTLILDVYFDVIIENISSNMWIHFTCYKCLSLNELCQALQSVPLFQYAQVFHCVLFNFSFSFIMCQMDFLNFLLKSPSLPCVNDGLFNIFPKSPNCHM